MDDENRAKYSIITAYDIYDSESWKDDFIDLDAFARNVDRKLSYIEEMDYDCFFMYTSGQRKQLDISMREL